VLAIGASGSLRAQRVVGWALSHGDELVNAAGFEASAKRSGLAFFDDASLVAALAASDSAACGYATLSAIIDFGAAGFEALVRLAAHPEMPRDVRVHSLRVILDSFESEDVSTAESSLPPEALDELEEARRGRGWLVADIADEFERPATSLHPEAQAPPPRPPKPRATAVNSDFDRAITEPRAPAAEVDEVDEPSVPPTAARSESPEVLPPETPEQPVEQVVEHRIDPWQARRALDQAVEAGPLGRGMVEKLAFTRAVPLDVRTRAINHLGSHFGQTSRHVLIQLLDAESSSIQNAALGALMVSGDVPLAPLVYLIRSERTTAKIRARATRHLGSRHPKDEAVPILEELLEDQSLQVRRAATDSLFPSLRSHKGEALERALVNLLEHHDSTRVKISAAKALAAFGTEACLEALEEWTSGLFQDSVLKDAAREAIARIVTRASNAPTE
jgi:HEAT repeat protein